MSEWKAAFGSALRVGALLLVSMLTNLAVSPFEPVEAALLSEIVSVLLTAFVLGYAEAFFIGQPRLVIEWNDAKNVKRLPRIDVSVSENNLEGALVKFSVMSYAERPLARLMLARAAKAGKLGIKIVPKHAPLIFSVDNSSRRRDDDAPLVRREATGPNVVGDLTGDPPAKGGTWIWARGTFTASDFLPGEEWELDYKVKGSLLIRWLVRVEADVSLVTIQSR